MNPNHGQPTRVWDDIESHSKNLADTLDDVIDQQYHARKGNTSIRKCWFRDMARIANMFQLKLFDGKDMRCAQRGMLSLIIKDSSRRDRINFHASEGVQRRH